MHRYTATTTWSRDGAAFADLRYNRAHRWKFDGGLDLLASSSPQHVRVPMSDPAGVDPEEALVASLSSCHMLSFLYVAAKRGIVVDSYVDDAEGVMDRNEEGRLAITRVVLRPRVVYATPPDSATEAALHHQAHEDCYIANSVRTEVVVEPVS
ncbi:MAG TPA: OsmC family protein, partial [Gemmatimonadaceae bacterium]|nr:OsmC family protein [Gemmatimonadaceae bacterium]